MISCHVTSVFVGGGFRQSAGKRVPQLTSCPSCSSCWRHQGNGVFVIVTVRMAVMFGFSAQMQFKYAQKGEHGELFEKGVVLARQFLGEGNWEVWDLRPDCDKWCQRCSSKAERLVRHNNGPCPERTNQRALGERRSAARRKAISEAKETERIRQVPVDEEPGVEPHTSGESDHDGHVSRAGPKKTAVIPAPLPRKAPAMPPGDDDSDYEDQQRPKKSRAVASATAPQRRRTARARSPGESEYEYKPRPTKSRTVARAMVVSATPTAPPEVHSAVPEVQATVPEIQTAVPEVQATVPEVEAAPFVAPTRVINELDAMHRQFLDDHRLKHKKEPTSAEWYKLRSEAEAKLAVLDNSKRKRRPTSLYRGMLRDNP